MRCKWNNPGFQIRGQTLFEIQIGIGGSGPRNRSSGTYLISGKILTKVTAKFIMIYARVLPPRLHFLRLMAGLSFLPGRAQAPCGWRPVCFRPFSACSDQTGPG